MSLTCRASSISALRNILLDPSAQNRLSPSELQTTLEARLTTLKTPWEPFGRLNNQSREALRAAKVTLPGSNRSVEVDEKVRRLAYGLGDRAGIDELQAFGLIIS